MHAILDILALLQMPVLLKSELAFLLMFISVSSKHMYVNLLNFILDLFSLVRCRFVRFGLKVDYDQLVSFTIGLQYVHCKWHAYLAKSSAT